MTMARATPLLTTIAQVAARTGVQDLARLEADSELTIANLLAQVHAWAFDRLLAEGEQPAQLTNETSYELVEATELVRILTARGYLQGDALALREEVERLWRGVRPTYPAAVDTPSHNGAGIPAVANMDAEPLLGGPDGRRARSRPRYDGTFPLQW